MRFSQRGDVHFFKGVPGWSWTLFFIDLRRSGEASGEHLRPPLGEFERPWGHFGRRGVNLGNFEPPWDHFGGLEGHFVIFLRYRLDIPLTFLRYSFGISRIPGVFLRYSSGIPHVFLGLCGFESKK